MITGLGLLRLLLIAYPVVAAPFLNESSWQDGQAEILAYSVVRSYKGVEIRYPAHIVTEKVWQQKDGLLVRKAGAGKPLLHSTLAYTFNADGFAHNHHASVQVGGDPLRLVTQESLVANWKGVIRKKLTQGPKVRLEIETNGFVSGLTQEWDKTPIFTEEMLFSYLRSLPFAKGYTEDIWLIEPMLDERVTPRIRYGKIRVEYKIAGIKDLTTWYVTVTRENAKKLEFWVNVSGLRPVVRAILSDGSVWEIKSIDRQKYWTW